MIANFFIEDSEVLKEDTQKVTVDSYTWMTSSWSSPMDLNGIHSNIHLTTEDETDDHISFLDTEV
jgi:hypothetical protein